MREAHAPHEATLLTIHTAQAHSSSTARPGGDVQCALARKMRASVQLHAVRFSSLVSPECKFVAVYFRVATVYVHCKRATAVAVTGGGFTASPHARRRLRHSTFNPSPPSTLVFGSEISDSLLN
eukprot:scaffold74753_cov74-Phaeocystis_antarctica.AAC.2